MAINDRSTLLTAVDNWLDRSDLTSRTPEFLELAEDWIAQNVRIRAMEEFVDLQLRKAIAVSADDVGGTANAITLITDPVQTSYLIGLTLSFEAEADNSSTVTVAVDCLTAQDLRKFDGTTALEVRDLINGHSYTIYYDGTQFRLIPPGGVPLPSRFLQVKRVWLDVAPRKILKFQEPSTFWSLRGSTKVGEPDMYTIEGEYIVFGPQPDGAHSARVVYYRRFAALSANSDTNWLLVNARGLYLYPCLLESAPFIGNDARLLTWAALRDQLLEDVHLADSRDRHGGYAPEMRVLGTFH